MSKGMKDEMEKNDICQKALEVRCNVGISSIGIVHRRSLLTANLVNEWMSHQVCPRETLSDRSSSTSKPEN